MLKKLLFTVVPMLMPFALYGIYWWGARRRTSQGLSDVPWTMLFATGTVLMIISLASFRLFSGYETGLEYSPARVEDGRIVPAETK